MLFSRVIISYKIYLFLLDVLYVIINSLVLPLFHNITIHTFKQYLRLKENTIYKTLLLFLVNISIKYECLWLSAFLFCYLNFWSYVYYSYINSNQSQNILDLEYYVTRPQIIDPKIFDDELCSWPESFLDQDNIWSIQISEVLEYEQ